MMKQTNISQHDIELDELCKTVRKYVVDGAYEAGVEIICQAMGSFPHAPQPHNLLGIILEKRGNHHAAMQHFRAALALDPSYYPANHNLYTYGTFFSKGHCAFDESDVPCESHGKMELVYNKKGVGHAVYKGRK